MQKNEALLSGIQVFALFLRVWWSLSQAVWGVQQNEALLSGIQVFHVILGCGYCSLKQFRECKKCTSPTRNTSFQIYFPKRNTGFHIISGLWLLLPQEVSGMQTKCSPPKRNTSFRFVLRCGDRSHKRCRDAKKWNSVVMARAKGFGNAKKMKTSWAEYKFSHYFGLWLPGIRQFRAHQF